MSCKRGLASINPDYELQGAEELEPGDGIPVGQFAEWYTDLHTDLHGESDVAMSRDRRKDPWIVRGLRVAIVQPPGERER